MPSERLDRNLFVVIGVILGGANVAFCAMVLSSRLSTVEIVLASCAIVLGTFPAPLDIWLEKCQSDLRKAPWYLRLCAIAPIVSIILTIALFVFCSREASEKQDADFDAANRVHGTGVSSYH